MTQPLKVPLSSNSFPQQLTVAETDSEILCTTAQLHVVAQEALELFSTASGGYL
jgi:hypothetical protein